MKNIKSINEWLDSPGSVDVPGQAYDAKVNSRNYKGVDPTMPIGIDAMYEASYFNEFLDEQGGSEDFQRFIDKKRSGKDITEYLKTSLQKKMIKG
jgi:hypothetical protein